jgi:hypothetical protein
VIAREYGFRSWRQLREAVLPESPVDDTEDPLEVWYTSRLLAGAAFMGMLEFSLCRHDGQLSLEGWGEATSLQEFAELAPGGDSSGNERKPAPVDRVWERLLTMAEMTDPQATKGLIRVSLMDRYPYTHWFVSVTRADPDRLDFVLRLNDVDRIPPSREQGSSGRRMAGLIRQGAAEPLSPEQDAALDQIADRYDRATFHRATVHEVAKLVPKAAHNHDAIALCARLVGGFGYHTVALVDIAGMAAACDHSCPDLLPLAELVVRRLSGTGDMPRLAKAVVAAQSEEELAEIRQEIAQLEATADFATIEEAYDQQSFV